MRIGGLASGMDIDSLVADLMKAERIPLDKLTQKRIWTEWQKDAYRDINLQLSELRTSASKLRLQSSFNAYSAVSSNPDILNAAATANAAPGSYSVTVKGLAASAKLNSESELVGKKSDSIVPAGEFTLTTDKGTTTIKADGTTETYADIAKKITNATNASGESLGLRANFDNTTSRFFISTKEMGSAKSIEISAAPSGDAALANHIMGGTAGTYTGEQGTDAEVDLKGSNGTTITVTDSTNTITVNGMKLDLLKADSGTSVTINVQSDTESTFNTIKEFVEKYNEVIEKIEGKLVEPRHRNFQPLTDKQKEGMSEKEIELWEERAKSGLLRGDQILQSTLYSLRRGMMDTVSGIAGGEVDLLSEIGINTGDYKQGGKLFIDEAKLKQALQDKPDEVMNLFTKKDDTGSGVGQRIYKELSNAVDRLGDRAGTPGTLVDNSTLSKRIREMNKEISNWDNRLSRLEDRYWKQFTAMEKALNQMNQQSMWMQQNMFGGM